MRHVCEIRGIQKRSRNNESTHVRPAEVVLGCCLDTSGNAIKEQLVDAARRRRQKEKIRQLLRSAVSDQAGSGRYIYARNIDALPSLPCWPKNNYSVHKEL
jgi:hypothetical protein